MSLKLTPHTWRSVLETLYHNVCLSAMDCDRSVLESMVRNGLARKTNNGRTVTYVITSKGKDLWENGRNNGNWHFTVVIKYRKIDEAH